MPNAALAHFLPLLTEKMFHHKSGSRMPVSKDEKELRTSSWWRPKLQCLDKKKNTFQDPKGSIPLNVTINLNKSYSSYQTTVSILLQSSNHERLVYFSEWSSSYHPNPADQLYLAYTPGNTAGQATKQADKLILENLIINVFNFFEG